MSARLEQPELFSEAELSAAVMVKTTVSSDFVGQGEFLRKIPIVVTSNGSRTDLQPFTRLLQHLCRQQLRRRLEQAMNANLFLPILTEQGFNITPVCNNLCLDLPKIGIKGNAIILHARMCRGADSSLFQLYKHFDHTCFSSRQEDAIKEQLLKDFASMRVNLIIIQDGSLWQDREWNRVYSFLKYLANYGHTCAVITVLTGFSDAALSYLPIVKKNRVKCIVLSEQRDWPIEVLIKIFYGQNLTKEESERAKVLLKIVRKKCKGDLNQIVHVMNDITKRAPRPSKLSETFIKDTLDHLPPVERRRRHNQ